jgi:hypothetical protein
MIIIIVKARFKKCKIRKLLAFIFRYLFVCVLASIYLILVSDNSEILVGLAVVINCLM